MGNVIIILSLLALAMSRKSKGIGYARHRTFGGNSGYDGYSMSKRAVWARSEGKYPKTDFKRVYGLTPKMFNLLLGCEIIMSYEWHHTSSWGNETPFYEWDAPSYRADLADSVYDNPFYQIYKQNKDELSRLANSKEIQTGKNWKGEMYISIPTEIKERVWEIFDV